MPSKNYRSRRSQQLQRTHSASLRSPLNFNALGHTRFRSCQNREKLLHRAAGSDGRASLIAVQELRAKARGRSGESMRRIRVFAALLAGLAMATCSLAADAWVIRFRTQSPYRYFEPPCGPAVYWTSEVLFHNTSDKPQTVRLLSGTGTFPAVVSGAMVIGPHSTRSTVQGRADAEIGDDNSPSPSGVGVHHFDVPDGVAIGSRADMFANDPTTSCFFGTGFFILGSLPLPVFRQLVPANQPQVHLGADLGINPRHTNVIIYNGGTAPATATIEYRAACDEALVERRLVSLQPNTVAQVVGLTDAVDQICHTGDTAEPTTRYVTVTMDQPGFSHVMTVSNVSTYPTIGVTSASGP